jgi:phosphoglycolate phosphatase-like HAD superfamily hydrolase
MVRLALFDIDGTLIRTDGAGVAAFGRAFEAAFGIPQATAGMKFAGRTDTSLTRELFVRHGLEPSPARFQQFFDCYVCCLEQLMAASTGSVCRGVPEFLGQLRALPEPPAIGLLTGNVRLGAEIKLRRFGLWDQFVTGAFGDDDEDRNRIAHVARGRGSRLLGRALAGDEILVVGDTPHDVACGRAIGARVLAVSTGGSSPEELRGAQPDWLVPDLGGVGAGEVCA